MMMRLLYVVLAVIALELAQARVAEDIKTVLVLGSGGLIGRSMVQWLEAHNFRVLEVKNREHIDLRKDGALDVFNNESVDFCMFLACEVGGSKFIESSSDDVQLSIVESNIRMYQVVFGWLRQHKIRFLFTSSYLQGTPHAYGAVKRLGEQWLMQFGGLGKIQRLWNVYGEEKVSIKSHVMSDWVGACVMTGKVTSLTDGMELRQFVYVKDVAAALGTGMMHFDDVDMISDISSGEWVSMRHVGRSLENAVADVGNRPCQVDFAPKPANPREHVSPNMSQALHRFWQPAIDLDKGLAMLVADTLPTLDLDAPAATIDRTEL